MHPASMKLRVSWCMLVALLPLCAVPGVAQVPPPVIIVGPAPDFSATACPGEKPGVLKARVFPRIPISSASEANFHAHNPSSLGSFIEIIRHDGRGASLIPPTLDIDSEMHGALVQLGSLVTINDPIAGCGTAAAVFLVSFHVQNGSVEMGVAAVATPPPSASLPAAQSVFVGPTPDPSATRCPGESDPRRQFSGPHSIIVTSTSAMDFFIHNPQNPQHTNTPEVLFIIELRLDGGAAIRIPGDVILDDGLHSEMLAYTRALSIHPAIPGCARPAAVFVGSVSLRDGAIVVAPIATGSAPESAMPSGRP